MAAHTLTKIGVKCIMLEAGPLLDLERHRVLKPVADLPYRGFGTPDRFPHVTQASEFDENLWADENRTRIRTIQQTRTTGYACGWWAAKPCDGAAPAGGLAI